MENIYLTMSGRGFAGARFALQTVVTETNQRLFADLHPTTPSHPRQDKRRPRGGEMVAMTRSNDGDSQPPIEGRCWWGDCMGQEKYGRRTQELWNVKCE